MRHDASHSIEQGLGEEIDETDLAFSLREALLGVEDDDRNGELELGFDLGLNGPLLEKGCRPLLGDLVGSRLNERLKSATRCAYMPVQHDTHRVADIGALHEAGAQKESILSHVGRAVAVVAQTCSEVGKLADKGKVPAHVGGKDRGEEDLPEIRVAVIGLEEVAKTMQLEHACKCDGMEVLEDGLVVVDLGGGRPGIDHVGVG